jgi:hypothetical protein
MFSIHLRLGLPSGLFPSGFSTYNLYTFLFSPIRDFVNSRLTDGGEFNFTLLPALAAALISRFSFLLDAQSTQWPQCGWKDKIKNSNDLIGDQTSNFQACSRVPQSATLYTAEIIDCIMQTPHLQCYHLQIASKFPVISTPQQYNISGKRLQTATGERTTISM